MFVSTAQALAAPQPSVFQPHFYSLAALEMQDIPAILTLMRQVMEELTLAHKGSFVLPKTAETYASYLCPSHKKGFMLGLKDKEENLIGSVILDFVHPTKDERTGLTSCAGVAPLLQALRQQQEPYCVIENALVSEEHRGQKLLPLMLNAGMKVTADLHGITSFAAEIAVNNIASKKSFDRCHFNLSCEGVDETDGTPLVFVHRSLKSSNILKL